MNTIQVVNEMNQKYEEGVVYSTTAYGMFQRIPGNRPVFEPALHRLIASIQECNMLEDQNILVNENFGVADGQTRLKAAEVLGLPIYFKIRHGLTLKHVQLLNRYTREWSMEDFLSSYIEAGRKDYIVLKEFAENYKLSLPIATAILADELIKREELSNKFKDGQFTIPDFDKADRLASLLTEVRLYSPDRCWVDRRLMQALQNFITTGDPKRLGKKLKEYGLAVTRRNSVREYEIEIDNIINFSGRDL